MKPSDVIRLFQIVGACAVIVYCVLQLAQDVRLPQTDIIWPGRFGRIGHIARWQAELVYVIFIILCGSLVIHALRTGSTGGSVSQDKRDNI